MFKFKSLLFTILSAILFALNEVQGHGMMLDPPNRSSRWRTNSSAPVNYDDNGLFCGGYGVQWFKNGGKCGLCGDDYSTSKPRPNELGGKYGEGVITKSYLNVHTATLGIKITTNHLGFFYFHLCNLDEFDGESEECFNKYRITLVDGSDKLYIGTASGWVNATIVFPTGLSCEHCVLRWSYQAGNNWGNCGNGTYAQGCGPQENFKGCADINITTAVRDETSKSVDDDNEIPTDPEEYYIPVKQPWNSISSTHYCMDVSPLLPMHKFLGGRLVQCWYMVGFFTPSKDPYFQKPPRAKKGKKSFPNRKLWKFFN